jgi:dCMP deaminase
MSESRSREWWDRWFLGLALYVSSASKDPNTKVGAVIVDDKRIVSAGYNGFAVGVEDREDRLADRNIKLKMILHGEHNAILFARRDLRGSTLYTSPLPPCAGCAAMIVQVGIKRVVSWFPSKLHLERWGEDFSIAETMFEEASITLNLYERDMHEAV